MRSAPIIAIDWGSTERRIYSVEPDGSGLVLETGDGALMVKPSDYPHIVADIRRRHGNRPILIAGMAGSDRGWHFAPYVRCPADIAGLAAAVIWVTPDIAILPGVSFVSDERGDVMRGEEIQALGALAAAFVPEGAAICQPGTHCKWIEIEGAKISRFKTAITGEIFALLKRYSSLSSALAAPVTANSAFAEGVGRSLQQQNLLGDLFALRADMMLERASAENLASRASGLLIGADIAAHSRPHSMVHLLGSDDSLRALYQSAFETAGIAVQLVDLQQAFIAGVHALRQHL